MMMMMVVGRCVVGGEREVHFLFFLLCVFRFCVFTFEEERFFPSFLLVFFCVVRQR